MVTLTKGRKQPETTDVSEGVSGWFDALSDNILLDDAHAHEGTDSYRLTSKAVYAQTTTTGTSWVSPVNGVYQLSVPIPAGLDNTKYDLAFQTSGGVRVYLDYTVESTTGFIVYSNDNTANYTVLFLS